jgi:16S rRNA (adenine1518-N6/adenine1519-N6)-dimethyltransferase
MAEAAEIGAEEEVLEIGPGLGVLTRVLADRARRVVAVELDRDLAAQLAGRLRVSNLEVVQDDALRFDPSEYFAGPYKLVANLPYQVSSPVLQRYLLEVRRPEKLVLMLQREVAERLAAPPGQASYLSILARAVASVRIVQRVPPTAFYPRPRVESAVVVLRPHDVPLVPEGQLGALLQFVRAGFQQPRRTLANSLALGLARPRMAVEFLIRSAGLAPEARPQALDVSEWVALHSTFAARATC